MKSKREYEKMFNALNIPVEDVDRDYSPDEFGRRLMSGYLYKEDVSYTYSTTPVDKTEAATEHKYEVVYS